MLSLAILAGCAHHARSASFALAATKTSPACVNPDDSGAIRLAAYSQDDSPLPEAAPDPAVDRNSEPTSGGVGEENENDSPDVELLPTVPPNTDAEPLTLDEVIRSTYLRFPLLESALASRDVAFGNHLAAHGAFDLKLKGATENSPLGFYETYRQSVGLIQPLYSGSEVWGGYRIGRGSFEPWYLERQTNDGGEFKAGVTVPLLRNRTIDERRAELWRTRLDQQLAQFDIQAQVIAFVQEAGYAYWDWVAAGRQQEIAKRVLDLAVSRTDRIKRQVDLGLIDPPELTENLRLVADRQAKLADATRKLEQKAAKLSLYFRDETGRPIVPPSTRLPRFPEPRLIDAARVAEDIQVALESRPDLQLIDTLRRQFEIDRQQAYNTLQPDLSAVIWGSQDVGTPSSSKRDKSPFVMEAGMYVDVPVQRRKARGKITAVEAKLRQLAAKRRMTQDKIAVDVQTAYAALTASFKQVQQTREAVQLAEELAERERRNFEAGASDLIEVTLR